MDNRIWTVVGPLPSDRAGFGTLYIVAGDAGEEAVAKLVPKDPGAERELLMGDSLAAAKYRNIVPVLDQGEHEHDWVIVMPRAEQSLAAYLRDRGPLSMDDLVPVLRDVATALAEIDGTIVHRDLKPPNILLLNGAWCLADFGISRYAEKTTSNDTRKFSLTPPYAAPEQWRAQRATSATDVYAFGVIAHELATGELPFPGPDAESFRQQHLNNPAPSLSIGTTRLRDLLDECLFKAPAARPRPAAILQRLEKIAEEPKVAGFEQLAAVNREELARRAAAHAKASTEQEERERRKELHDAAVQSLTRLSNDLLEAVTTNATTAEVELNAGRGKMFFVATLNGARIGLARPELSSSTWTTPFTVVSEAIITVNLAGDGVRGWRGRSHSLWFCDAKEEDQFAWHELAFMSSPFGGQPAVVPFPLSAAEGRVAFEPVIGSTQLAWPLEKIDRGDLTALLGRWLGWFAEAAKGRLQQPGMLPERPAEGSWRKA
ncbi:protein kinase domain-containing protein [Mycobacterium simiae]|uniref:protein kinase domain-containing protein n=1 Tax=Mycobacterium simiae TaxID=1784 RepID=UPI0020CB672B|nr:serine/threonine-protein kinase [Mycobacterium simiae]